MFDIGFLELLLITIIGLVVLGPERLPVAIRTVRGWISGVRKFSDSVKTELTEELRIQELHANLKKAEQADMKNLSPEIAESIKTLKDAAEMVNRPYQLDKEPDHLVIEKSPRQLKFLMKSKQLPTFHLHQKIE